MSPINGDGTSPFEPASDDGGAEASLDADISASADAPLIAPGIYRAMFRRFVIFKVFRGQKLAMFWEVEVPAGGDRAGHLVEVPRYYNIKAGRGRTLEVGKHSDYRRDWIRVTCRRPHEGNRLSPLAFKGTLVLAEVRSVTRDSRGRELPAQAQYSVIDHLVEVISGPSR